MNKEEGSVFDAEKINIQLEKLEYAKQEAIEFIKWAVKNHNISCKGFSPIVYSFIDGDMREIGANKLYELYQQSKTQP